MPKEVSQRDALTATPRPTGHPGYSQTLPREPESAGVARRLARNALAAWGQDGLVEDAVLIITELVSNAVDHAGFGSIRVIVSRPSDEYIHIGVMDRSRAIPHMRTDSDGYQLRGRGLLMVDALTERWGTDLHRWGKQVWGELKCDGPP
ncbi:ATP-binding protein [Streptomyces sp. A5-4]|uniref:ATP-binding protein n=1 Tax=Streptomyces sp. A5-4 TaxID=3384771 RepID=UPI003DA91577